MKRRKKNRLHSDAALLRELRAAEATGISARRLPDIAKAVKRRIRKKA